MESPVGPWANSSFPGFPLNESCLLPPDAIDCTNVTGVVPRGGAGVAGVLIPLIYVVVCVVGLGGNTLVIHIVLHYSKAQSVTNFYILNLALADELFMLGLPFLAAQTALRTWPFGSLMCRLVMTVDGINQFTSIFCLTVMSVDRYLAVVHPIRSSRWRRPRVAKLVNGTVWALSFTVVLPVVIFADVLEEQGGICNIVWPQPAGVWRAAFIIHTSTVGFFCPLLVICMCYLLIVAKIRSSGKKVHASSAKRRRSERRVTRMVVIVVALFVFCWLPFYALNIINLVVPLPAEPQGLYYSVVVLSYANSCANPIVYGFLSDNFKRGFRKALCRASRRVESREAAEERARRQREERGRALLPRESLRRGVREQEEEEEEEEEQEEEMTEMTEICRIAQNGTGSGPSGRNDPAGGSAQCHSPDRGAAGGEAAGVGGGTDRNGSVKQLPEETDRNSLQISCL